VTAARLPPIVVRASAFLSIFFLDKGRGLPRPCALAPPAGRPLAPPAAARLPPVVVRASAFLSISFLDKGRGLPRPCALACRLSAARQHSAR